MCTHTRSAPAGTVAGSRGSFDLPLLLPLLPLRGTTAYTSAVQAGPACRVPVVIFVVILIFVGSRSTATSCAVHSIGCPAGSGPCTSSRHPWLSTAVIGNGSALRARIMGGNVHCGKR